ncbi:MAG: peptidoglycan DD-metalloendopeptidase family protein [Chromatiaceae bacterium]
MWSRRFLYPLVSGLVFTLVAVAGAQPDADRQAQLDALRDRIETLRGQMRTTSGERSELTRELQEAEQQIGRLARRLRVLDGRLERQRHELAVLLGERSEQNEALARQRAELSRQVRAAYAMGRQERLRILLNQQDPATVSRMMAYYDYLNRARAEKMQDIRAHLARLDETEQAIRREENALAALLEEQRGELAALNDSQTQRQSVVAALTRDLQDQGRQLDRLQRDEQDLKDLIEGLEEALADIPAEPPQRQRFAGLRGQLPWPAVGRITHRYGTPRLGSLRWDGVMISAPEGNEVRAVHYGRVAFADWLRGFGLLLIVDHGDGFMTLYGHNQSLFKEVGDWVDSNEPIALVGSSGGREQAGVYFGIRHEGRPVNPAQWCRRPDGRRVG